MQISIKNTTPAATYKIPKLFADRKEMTHLEEKSKKAVALNHSSIVEIDVIKSN